ncbi:hypothetical protein [Mesorhizobium sp. L2C066B000]|uniref:tetratricopeptide repeat protein n=1 Tax=Mesorhizobium sp. L2C066B000 TaxID=1287105 RepID=UPI0009DDA3A8|nr:hypothetical protein [Mesorhizobium sp. L2C066B000]
MDIDEFRATLQDVEPPANLGMALHALWWDRQGDWERAHECAQANESDPTSAWVHAYLHRKEGDLSNAAYWYRRAGQPVETGKLDAEWASITGSLLLG